MSDCAHTTVLVTQHFDGQVQPVYTWDCMQCGDNLRDDRIKVKK